MIRISRGNGRTAVSGLNRSHTRILAALGWPAQQLAYARQLIACGKFRMALPLLVKAAKAGLAGAWCELGQSYLFGRGVPACLPEALSWLTRAAEAGEVDAQSLLATLALQGVSRPAPNGGLFGAIGTRADEGPDYEQAMTWAQCAAVSGDPAAQAVLGFILTSGPPQVRDPAQGADWYRRAAEAGNAQGQLGWALALLQRDPTGRLGEARDLLNAAAAAGIPTAHYILGMLAECGVGGTQDCVAAVEHYRSGAEQGHRSAQLRYGIALMTGRGVARDTLNGESWLRRAGLAGEPVAAAMVGDLYACAGTLPANNVEAMMWFRRAAEAGHAGAARALGHLYLGGHGVCADTEEAALWLRSAIAHGDAMARADLARLALARQVPEADQQTTFAWFVEQAGSGEPAAAFNLGICLAEGIGTGRDEVRALALFRHAARYLPEAQYWCGRMLAEGRGASLDVVAAREWFLKAAEQGNADAEVAAGEMLVNGRGGPPDPDKAMALFRHAAAAGHPGALLALDILSGAASVSVPV